MDGKFMHVADDGTSTDVTEGVQALYDLVLDSLNWGSGFWTWEDALPVALVGHLGGFERIDEVDRYVNERRHDEERQEWIFSHPEAQVPYNPASIMSGWGGSVSDLLAGVGPVPHDHVFSSVGRCMWPRCSERE